MRSFLVAALLASCLVAVPSVATAGGEAPLADAGLDQHVDHGATVMLDATGSRDPDGSLRAYQWRIETPGGGVVTPAEPTAPRTEFVATEPGRYEVTVTVTDGTGRSASDTLYVYVEARAPSRTTPANSPTPSTDTADASDGSRDSAVTVLVPETGSAEPPDSVDANTPAIAIGSPPAAPAGVPAPGLAVDLPSLSAPTVELPDFDRPARTRIVVQEASPEAVQSQDNVDLVLYGSNLDYKEDAGVGSILGSAYSDGADVSCTRRNCRKGLETAIGEVQEGATGIRKGSGQAVHGQNERVITYTVSVEEARKLAKTPNYNRGKYEDEWHEKAGVNDDQGVAVTENRILSDSRVVDGLSERETRADKVKVTVVVSERKPFLQKVRQALAGEKGTSERPSKNLERTDSRRIGYEGSDGVIYASKRKAAINSYKTVTRGEGVRTVRYDGNAVDQALDTGSDVAEHAVNNYVQNKVDTINGALDAVESTANRPSTDDSTGQPSSEDSSGASVDTGPVAASGDTDETDTGGGTGDKSNQKEEESIVSDAVGAVTDAMDGSQSDESERPSSSAGGSDSKSSGSDRGDGGILDSITSSVKDQLGDSSSADGGDSSDDTGSENDGGDGENGIGGGLIPII